MFCFQWDYEKSQQVVKSYYQELLSRVITRLRQNSRRLFVSLRNPKRDPLLAGLFLFATFLGSSVGSAPLPLFQSIIRAPICGRAYSGPAALPLLTQEINVRIRRLHSGFSLSVSMPNLNKRQSDKTFGALLFKREAVVQRVCLRK